MFLPTISALPDSQTPCSVYLESNVFDKIRVHVCISEEGVASPMLFIGNILYRIER